MGVQEMLDKILDSVRGFPHKVVNGGVVVFSRGNYPGVPRGAFIGIVRPSEDGTYPEINKFGSEFPKLSEDVETELVHEGFTRVGTVSIEEDQCWPLPLVAA